MKAVAFSAMVFAVVLATVPGAYACSESAGATKPDRIGLQKRDKEVAAQSDLAVLVGLLLGIAHPLAGDLACQLGFAQIDDLRAFGIIGGLFLLFSLRMQRACEEHAKENQKCFFCL